MSRKSTRPGWKRWLPRKATSVSTFDYPQDERKTLPVVRDTLTGAVDVLPDRPEVRELVRAFSEDQLLVTTVWSRASSATKAHLVNVRITNVSDLFEGRGITSQMKPTGACSTSRKVQWVGKSIVVPTDTSMCAQCSKLPAATRKVNR